MDCDQIYIGETTQKLSTRIQQHANSTSETNLNKDNVASALAKHAKITGHKFDFSAPKILQQQQNKRKLQISEVNHIVMNQEIACNFKTDSKHIAPTYFNLLHKFIGKNDPTSLIQQNTTDVQR